MPVPEAMERLAGRRDVWDGQSIPIELLTAANHEGPEAEASSSLQAAPICGEVGHQMRPVVQEHILRQPCMANTMLKGTEICNLLAFTGSRHDQHSLAMGEPG